MHNTRETPLVSVILTCFNDETTIIRAIESIKSQTYDDIELVVVDDGSVDKTLKKARSVAAENLKFNILTKSNGGLGSARDYGVRNATGELITFLDADDEFSPQKIELQVNNIKDLSNAVLFSGAITKQASNSQLRHTRGCTREITDAYSSGQDLPAANASMMLRSDDYKAWGGFSTEMRRNCEEHFLLRVFAYGGRLFILEKPLYIVNESFSSNRHIYKNKLPFFRKNIQFAEKLAKSSNTIRSDRVVRYCHTIARNAAISSLKMPLSYKIELSKEISANSKYILGSSRHLYSFIAFFPIQIPKAVWGLIRRFKRQFKRKT